MSSPAAESPVILRRYLAGSYEGALDQYEADLPGMAEAGWFPVGQVWGWDPLGSPGWVLGGSHWKPGDGTLAVTYRHDPRPAASTER